MKSQREVQIRRLAVFGGFGHPEPGPTWSPSAYRDARLRHGEQDVARRPSETDDENTVIQLDRISRPAELYRAA